MYHFCPHFPGHNSSYDCTWLQRVLWTARRSNQSILKEISPEYSLEGLMLKLKLQYFGHLMRRTDSLEKTLMLAKTEGRRRRGWQRMRWLDGIHQLDGHEFEQAPGVGDGQGSLACSSPWGRKESDTTEQLNWTELNWSNVWEIEIAQNYTVFSISMCSSSFIFFLSKWQYPHIYFI